MDGRTDSDGAKVRTYGEWSYTDVDGELEIEEDHRAVAPRMTIATAAAAAARAAERRGRERASPRVSGRADGRTDHTGTQATGGLDG